jgi:hypothetical protein
VISLGQFTILFLYKHLELINITIKFEKLNLTKLKLKIMEQVLKVLKSEEYDRYIFITYEEDNIVGLNFHQGVDAIDNYFVKPCPYTTETFMRMISNNPIYNKTEDEIYQIMNDAIEIVCQVITYTYDSTEHKLPPSKLYGEYLDQVMNKFDISNQEARRRYGQFTISQWKQIL